MYFVSDYAIRIERNTLILEGYQYHPSIRHVLLRLLSLFVTFKVFVYAKQMRIHGHDGKLETIEREDRQQHCLLYSLFTDAISLPFFLVLHRCQSLLWPFLLLKTFSLVVDTRQFLGQDSFSKTLCFIRF